MPPRPSSISLDQLSPSERERIIQRMRNTEQIFQRGPLPSAPPGDLAQRDLSAATVVTSTPHGFQPGDTVTLEMPTVYPQVEDQHQRVRFRDLWSGPSSGWRAYLWLSGLKKRLCGFFKKCLETNRRWMNRDRDELNMEFARIDALEEDARQSHVAHFQAVHNYTYQEARAVGDPIFERAMQENARQIGIEASRQEDAAFLARVNQIASQVDASLPLSEGITADRLERVIGDWAIGVTQQNGREANRVLARRRQDELDVTFSAQQERNRLAGLQDSSAFRFRGGLESQSRGITLTPEQLEIGEIARDARTGRVYLRTDDGRIEELIRGPVTSNEQAPPAPPSSTPTEAFRPLLDV